MSTIEDRYFNDFGKCDYTAAVHYLWENHNKYGASGACPTWPPTLEQIKKEMKSISDGRAYANERR